MLRNFVLFLLRFTVKGNKNNAKSLLSAHVLSTFPGLNETLRKNTHRSPPMLSFPLPQPISVLSRASPISPCCLGSNHVSPISSVRFRRTARKEGGKQARQSPAWLLAQKEGGKQPAPPRRVSPFGWLDGVGWLVPHGVFGGALDHRPERVVSLLDHMNFAAWMSCFAGLTGTCGDSWRLSATRACARILRGSGWSSLTTAASGSPSFPCGVWRI